MTERTVLEPNEDHPISIEPARDRVTVHAGNTIVADTHAALTLREANYPAVHYIPRASVDMTLLRRSDHRTYCPYKGDASYFDLPALGERGANAVWSYEQPFASVAEIAQFLAFYPDRVSIVEVLQKDVHVRP
jgi:uncharacterized protein (DUF427 family)